MNVFGTARKKFLKNARGFVAYMLIGLTLIIYLMFYSYHNLLMNSFDRAHYTMSLQNVKNISFSAVNAIFPYLAYKCRTEPSGALAQFVFNSQDKDYDIDPSKEPLLKDLFKVFEPTVVEKIHLKAVSREDAAGRQEPDPDDTGHYQDPLEKKVIVEIGCIIYTGKIRYECKIKRRISKLLSVVPVYSKFTFLSRNKSAKSMIYNLYYNTIAGTPDKQNKFMPVTLFNHNDAEDPEGAAFSPSQKSYLTRGYIYFGSETILNKTSGFDNGHSEMYHFLKVGNELGITRCYTDMNAKVPFTPPNPPAGYRIEYTPLGYYNNLFADPSAPNVLKKYQGLPPFSSMLHLYGNQQNPSPTLVLGKVYHSFPIYKCLVNDLDHNKNYDSVPNLEYVLVNALESKSDFFSSPELALFPVNFSIASGGAHNSWKDFCGDSYANYAKIMSVVVKEPYNHVYNYLLYSGFMSQDAAAADSNVENKLSEAEISDCLTLNNFKCTVKDSSGADVTFFSGDPGNIDVTKILKNRIQVTYKNQEEFMRECLKTKKLSIPHCVIAIQKGPVILPENIEVAEGGVIFLNEGDFEINGVKAQAGQFLSLYAAAGNIKMNCAARYKYVSLNAPEGFVRNSSPGSTLDLTGNIACKFFDHTTFAEGGKVQYSQYLDPASIKFSAARYKLILHPSVLTLEYTRK